MNKHLLILGIAVLFLTVGLSGCLESSTDMSDDWETQYEKEKQLKQKFETAMESVAGDFVDEKYGNNYETSKNEEEYILNYNQSQFEYHSNLIYENDEYCEYDDSYGKQWVNCRDYVIRALECLVVKNYKLAREYFFDVDNEILMTDYMGDYWSKQFGFEEGVCDILWYMGYGIS